MSENNRIDVFQPEQKQMAIPAATTSVLLEGQLCPYLNTIEIIRAPYPEFNHAKLVYNPVSYSGTDLPAIEDIEAVFAMGKKISVQQVYNSGIGETEPRAYSVFDGQIEGINTQTGPKTNTIEIIAKDISAKLRRITVYGRCVPASNNQTLFLEGMDVVFNKDGKANAAIEAINNEGKTYNVFSADLSNSKFWSYAEIILYLLSEYLPAGEMGLPALEQLETLTNYEPARDMDVTGLDLVEALRRCCDHVGLQFKFVSRHNTNGPRQAIVFYRAGQGRVVEQNHQRNGEQLNISKTNVEKVTSKKNFWPVTHKYIGQGDFKIYEATFDLVKAWDPNLEDSDYDKFSPQTNENFHAVRDVYRKWCLNEGGDYSSSPYNQGQSFDFSQIFSNGNFIYRRRRFWPALTSDNTSSSMGYHLQVSYNDGQQWWQYPFAFNNLLDECGTWLSGKQLDVDTWVAAQKGVLKFRVTASVISDERLSHTFADGPINSVIDVVDHVVTLPRQFKYRQVSHKSIFYKSTDENIGPANEANDSKALAGFIRELAQNSSAIIEKIDMQTPIVAFDYYPGDKVVSSSESKDWLGCKTDGRSIYWIERVKMDFAQQCTNLKILRKRT